MGNEQFYGLLLVTRLPSAVDFGQKRKFFLRLVNLFDLETHLKIIVSHILSWIRTVL